MGGDKYDRAEKARQREKSRNQDRDSKSYGSKNSSFELAPSSGMPYFNAAQENRRMKEEIKRKEQEKKRKEKEDEEERVRKMKRRWVNHEDEEKERKIIKAKEGEKKPEEIDSEAKRNLQEIGEMDTVEEKAEYIYNLLKKDDKDKNKDKNKDKETEKERKNEKIAYAMLSHLQSAELYSIVASFNKKYPKKEIKLTGDITNSSLLRTTFSAKRSFLKTALELSLLPPDSPSLLSPPVSVFSVSPFDENGYAKKDLILQRLDKDELAHPLLPLYKETSFCSFVEYGMRSVVPSIGIFKEVFNVFTNSFFDGVDLQGSIIGGGAVTACLMPLSPYHYKLYNEYKKFKYCYNKFPLPSNVIDHIEGYVADPNLQRFRDEVSERFSTYYKKSDVDIFIMANTLQEGKTKLENLYNSITHKYNKLGKEFCVVRTINSVTICSEYPYRHIQLIISLLRNVDDFLLFADLDCTSCLYTGKKVIMSPRSIRAYNKRYNAMPPKSFINTIDKSRMIKYAERGFSSMVFELCKHTPRCDIELDAVTFDHVSRLCSLSSLSSLSRHREYGRIMCSRELYLDVRLPFGPEYNVEMIRTAAKESPHACAVGNNLHDIFSSDEFFENISKLEIEIENRWKNNNEGERETKHYSWEDVAGGEGEEMNEIETENKKQEWKRANLKGLRWKIMDTLRSRKTDDILPRCYMCNKRFLPTTHEQVGISLCVDCVKKNNEMFAKWDEVTELDDLVAIVTGARIKIGYHTALRLLRSGVTVIAVTRFPNDCAYRYSLEPDYIKWNSKLHIYGVDLRHLPSVNEFIAHVMQSYSRIDILINNAAQTIRRPRAYYRALIEQERVLNLSSSFSPKYLVKSVGGDPFLLEHNNDSDIENHGASMLAVATLPNDSTLPKSAALSQVKMLPMDMVDRDDENFPPGQVDEHNEQLDIRKETSWTLSIDQISPVELMEVQIVNSTVPFMFVSSFTPLLKNAAKVSKFKRSFVVNVTSAEGVFNMNKRGIHPHTNMAKAALNMMTKSIATTFAQVSIFATAVDTGWVTKMKPGVEGLYPTGDRGSTTAPLSDKDGAARVLHPVLFGLTSKSIPAFGVLYRNFEITPWN